MRWVRIERVKRSSRNQHNGSDMVEDKVVIDVLTDLIAEDGLLNDTDDDTEHVIS